MADNRSVICALAVALIVPLALAGCGRKGPLDPPPSAATPPPPTQQYQPAPSTTGLIDPLTPTGQAQQAPPPVQTTQVAPAQPQRKGFLLDPLISVIRVIASEAKQSRAARDESRASLDCFVAPLLAMTKSFATPAHPVLNTRPCITSIIAAASCTPRT